MNLYYSPSYAPQEMYTTQKSRWIADSLDARPIPGVIIAEPQPLAERDLWHAHARDYVTAVRTGCPLMLAESNGFVWTEANWRAACASNGGVLNAALTASRTHNAGSLSSGLHHARFDHGAGYCTFNGLALAAIVLASGGRRVLVLDLDAHCGGGTVSILTERGNASIVHADIAVCDFDGYFAMRDTDSLEIVSSAEAYIPTIARRLDALAEVPFDVLLYNAGMDPYEQDDVGGLDGITAAMLAERERLVFSWARARQLPAAFVLAGGYTGAANDPGALVDLHRLTIAAASV